MTEQIDEHRVGDRVRIGRGYADWTITTLYPESRMAVLEGHFIGVDNRVQTRTVAFRRLNNLSAQQRKES